MKLKPPELDVHIGSQRANEIEQAIKNLTDFSVKE